MMHQVQIEFGTGDQVKAFAQWFRREGFDCFLDSKEGEREAVSCMSTDEKMDWGYYFEIE